MDKELLPVGSVVELKDSTARVMVAGYLPVIPSRPDYAWDYSGFRFPIGYVRNDEIICFDDEQIETVISYGYKDIESVVFIEQVKNTMAEVRKTLAGGK